MSNCKYCNHGCLKAGKQANGNQKMRCKSCGKYQQLHYSSSAYQLQSNRKIITLHNEGISLRGIGRVLKISLTTVIARIKLIAKSIVKPVHQLTKGTYQIDEVWTFVGNKNNAVWLTYSYNSASKTVIDFRVGARAVVNLKPVVDSVLQTNAKAICTDGLAIYQNLIPTKIHKIGLPYTRHTERNNLTIRMRLKRLSRKTICFSKSLAMLENSLKIYFWARSQSPIFAT